MPKERRLRQTTLFNYNKTLSAQVLGRPSRALHSLSKHDRAKESESSDQSSSSAAIQVRSKSSRGSKIAGKQRNFRPIVDDSSEENTVIASANDEGASSMAKDTSVSRGKRSRRMRLESSDSDSEFPVKKKAVRRQVQEVSDEEENLEEEIDKDSILPTRFRERGRKTAFQKSLEKLKRRKLQKPAVSISPSESSGEYEEEENKDYVKPIKGAKPSHDYDNLFSEDSDDSNAPSDFIVEDDNAVRQELPAQFSMQTHQELSCQFKRVFQFFVHMAAHAPIERHKFMSMQIREEEYFSIPLQMIRRKLMGLRDSLVASSVWKPEFKTMMEKYPEFEITELSYAQPGCDACHLGGRRSTLVGRVTGFPYDRIGFETIDEDGEDEDEDECKKQEFHLGRFCARRTRVYHELTHWEYTLFKCIQEEVDDLYTARQNKEFIRIANAGRKRPPDDLEDADGIFEWLDSLKIVDMEWQRIKGVMESARHLDAFSKEDVD